MNRTDLTRYTELIRRRWRLLVIVIALALNVSIVQSLVSDETFETTSRIVIVERPAGDLLLNRDSRDLDRALQTELRALEGSELRTTANELLRFEPAVEFDTDEPDLLLVTARYNTAQGAAVIANTYASTFVAMRQNEEIERLRLAQGQVESQLDTLQLEIDDLESQLALDPADLRASVRLDARLSQQNELLGQIDDIDFLIASDPAGVELGEPATEPNDPISPRPVRSAIFAFVLGSVLAVVIALIADSLDDTVRSTSDLDAAGTGVPVLGAIPPCSLRPGKVASLEDPESATAEAYRTLRASVLHSLGRKPNLLIQITSPGRGEGKTNVAANLAVSFAMIGLKTAVIDADLRADDGLSKRFDEMAGTGLVELLIGERDLDTPLVRLGLSSTLRGLPRGSVTVNPAEVLSIDRARSVFRHFKESFDVTIVDTPEVLAYADATVMSGLVDATIVVLRAGATKRKTLGQAFTNLGLVDAHVLGTVLVDATDGLHRSDASAPGFVSFDERMLALGVGPPQLPPATMVVDERERAASILSGFDDIDEERDPIELPAADDTDIDEADTEVATPPQKATTPPQGDLPYDREAVEQQRRNADRRRANRAAAAMHDLPSPATRATSERKSATQTRDAEQPTPATTKAGNAKQARSAAKAGSSTTAEASSKAEATSTAGGAEKSREPARRSRMGSGSKPGDDPDAATDSPD